MTYEEYIKNPTGKSAVFGAGLKLQIKEFNDRWMMVRMREQQPPVHYLYKTDSDYIAHFKIPSEGVARFYYDVIVRFFPPATSGHVRYQKNLSNYEVQFFSNDPAFSFTHAHAFFVNNLFFKDLIPKANPISLKEKAIEKNPRDEIGYVKSFCFMYFDLKDLGLFDKSKWAKASKYNKVVWAGTVEHTSKKIEDRQYNGRAEVKKERKLARQQERENANPIKAVMNKFISPNIKNFGKAKFEPINKGIGRFKKK